MARIQYFIPKGTRIEQRKKNVSDWEPVTLAKDIWFTKKQHTSNHLIFFDPEIADAVGKDWDGKGATQYRIHKDSATDDGPRENPIRGGGQSSKPGSHGSSRHR